MRTNLKKLKSDPTEDLKRSLNKLIDRCNAETDRQLIPKLIGHFTPGYIYGNPKLHKKIRLIHLFAPLSHK